MNTIIFQPAADKAAQRAQDEAFNQGVEAAAAKADPGRKPCACIALDDGGYWQQSCDCSNSGDLADAQAWCSEMNTKVAILALKRPTAPADEGEAVDAAANKGEG